MELPSEHIHSQPMQNHTFSTPFALPPEIWSIIFRMASAEPAYITDTSLVSPVSYEPRSWTAALQAYYRIHYRSSGALARQQARLSIALVCKSWLKLCVGLILEHIYLQNLPALLSFCLSINEILGVAPTMQSVPFKDLGVNSLTKYLYVRITKSTINSFDNSSAAPPVRFPNLRVLDFTSLDTSEHIEALADEIIRSTTCLHHLIWRSRIPLSTAWVDCFKHLEVLSLYAYYRTSYNSLPAIVLPHLHTVELFHQSSLDAIEWISRCSVPNLCRLNIQIPSHGTHWASLATYLQSFSHQLKTLDLTPQTEDSRYESIANVNLPDILSGCSSLEDLSIHHTQLRELTPYPTLKRISICMHFIDGRTRASDETTRVMRGLEECIGQILTMSTKRQIQCLRLSDISSNGFGSTSWYDFYMNDWKRWIEQLEMKGIRFEMADGVLVREAYEEEWAEMVAGGDVGPAGPTSNVEAAGIGGEAESESEEDDDEGEFESESDFEQDYGSGYDEVDDISDVGSGSELFQ